MFVLPTENKGGIALTKGELEGLREKIEKLILNRQNEIMNKYKESPSLMTTERKQDELLRELKEDSFIMAHQNLLLKLILASPPEAIIIKAKTLSLIESNKEGE
jgi:hypothetical protein